MGLLRYRCAITELLVVCPKMNIGDVVSFRSVALLSHYLYEVVDELLLCFVRLRIEITFRNRIVFNEVVETNKR